MSPSDTLHRLQPAIDVSAEFIALLDRETMGFIHVNDAACKAVGYSRDEFLAMGPHQSSVHTREEFERAFDTLIENAPLSIQFRNTFRCRNGRLIPVDLNRRAIRCGDRWIILSTGRAVPTRRETEQALRESEETFRMMADSMPQMAWVAQADGRVVYINQRWIDYTGLPAEHGYGSGWQNSVHPDDIQGMGRGWKHSTETGEAFEQECRLRQADGAYRWFLVKGRAQLDRSGGVLKWFGTCTDIDERKSIEQAVKRHALQQGLIAKFGHLALASTDLEALQNLAMAFICDGLGVEHSLLLQIPAEGHGQVLKAGAGWNAGWIGRFMADTKSETQTRYVLTSRKAVVVENFATDTRFEPSEILTEHAVASGVEVLIAGPAGPYGVLGAFSRQPGRFTSRDADFLQSLANTLETAVERKNAEDKLAYMAQFDSLTGLPNRSLFSDRLAQTLTQAQRSAWSVAVLFLDLDRFKLVNDTMGHGAGDVLLRQVAERVQGCLRSGDTIARLSGDEFAIVLSNLARPADAGLVAQKVVAACAAAFDVDGKETHISASVGIALYPSDGENPDALLKNADIAMYRAKEHGRSRYQFYLPEMHERALARMQVEGQLRGALERGEFLLHYQPKADLYTGAISGFEALLRWQHPERGMVGPIEFISILEETGLIVPVGEWVLRTACAQINRWQKSGAARIPVAVNISARQFQQKDLDAVVGGILEESGADPRLLELELTESLLIKDPEQAARILQNLKTYGVRLTVDDFGTGYSSLAYLKRFPLDSLKIDRAFIRDCISDPDDAMIASAIVSLAQSLRLKVVGEGVETEEQLNFLRAQGCDEIQGYYFARPMAVEAVDEALRAGMRLPKSAFGYLSEAPAVLLVDDNRDDLEIFREALEPEGYRILAATNSHAALDILSKSDIALVISDHNMPGMSGVKFLASVRTLYPHVARAMLTGSDSHITLPDAVNEAGVHKFLSKHWAASRLQFEVRDAYKAALKQRTRDA